MKRKPREPSIRGTGLPFAVLRGIAAQYRFAPPANGEPGCRGLSRRRAERLLRLPADLWQLNIDWRRYTIEMDQLASVPVVDRTLSDEINQHASIALELRNAAQKLKGQGQADPMFAGVMTYLRHYGGGTFGEHAVLLRRCLTTDDPRLSDFLRAVADWFEGDKVRSYGLHRLDGGVQKKGPKGAAAVAFDGLCDFLEARTGTPSTRLVTQIVRAYHPLAATPPAPGIDPSIALADAIKADEAKWSRARVARKNARKKKAVFP